MGPLHVSFAMLTLDLYATYRSRAFQWFGSGIALLPTVLPSRANISRNKTTNQQLGYAASDSSVAFSCNPMLDPSAQERDFFFFRVF